MLQQLIRHNVFYSRKITEPRLWIWSRARALHVSVPVGVHRRAGAKIRYRSSCELKIVKARVYTSKSLNPPILL